MSEARFKALCAVTGSVSRETFDGLQAFERHFLKWSRHFNLAAPSTLESFWERHVLDSAQLLSLAKGADRWLDLGSGGGFPGVIVAILLRERMGASVDLVESNGKKAAFLRSTVELLGLPARVHKTRIEDCAGLIEGADIVTARALASLPILLALASPWLATGARALFHKGRDFAMEVEESREKWQFDLVLHRDVIDADARILEISDLQHRSQ